MLALQHILSTKGAIMATCRKPTVLFVLAIFMEILAAQASYAQTPQIVYGSWSGYATDYYTYYYPSGEVVTGEYSFSTSLDINVYVSNQPGSVGDVFLENCR